MESSDARVSQCWKWGLIMNAIDSRHLFLKDTALSFDGTSGLSSLDSHQNVLSDQITESNVKDFFNGALHVTSWLECVGLLRQKLSKDRADQATSRVCFKIAKESLIKTTALTFLPIVQSYRSLRGNITDNNRDEKFLLALQGIYRKKFESRRRIFLSHLGIYVQSNKLEKFTNDHAGNLPIFRQMKNNVSYMIKATCNQIVTVSMILSVITTLFVVEAFFFGICLIPPVFTILQIFPLHPLSVILFAFVGSMHSFYKGVSFDIALTTNKNRNDPREEALKYDYNAKDVWVLAKQIKQILKKIPLVKGFTNKKGEFSLQNLDKNGALLTREHYFKMDDQLNKLWTQSIQALVTP
jgi:hypothetical protein